MPIWEVIRGCDAVLVPRGGWSEGVVRKVDSYPPLICQCMTSYPPQSGHRAVSALGNCTLGGGLIVRPSVRGVLTHTPPA